MLEQLPTHLRDFVEREVAAGHYETETDVIEDALTRLADDAGRMTVEEAVAEALAQVERGEGRELTDSVFDELLAQSELDTRSGRPVRDDVRYSCGGISRR
jgi:Arc/MetJ-type ribon-helix-helix transcriptional regulator